MHYIGTDINYEIFLTSSETFISKGSIAVSSSIGFPAPHQVFSNIGTSGTAKKFLIFLYTQKHAIIRTVNDIIHTQAILSKCLCRINSNQRSLTKLELFMTLVTVKQWEL